MCQAKYALYLTTRKRKKEKKKKKPTTSPPLTSNISSLLQAQVPSRGRGDAFAQDKDMVAILIPVLPENVSLVLVSPFPQSPVRYSTINLQQPSWGGVALLPVIARTTHQVWHSHQSKGYDTSTVPWHPPPPVPRLPRTHPHTNKRAIYRIISILCFPCHTKPQHAHKASSAPG